MNGCHNKLRADGYWAQDGYARDGSGKPVSPKYIWVTDRMVKACQYDKRAIDAGCKECSK
jgi:hypothetical protein